MTDKRQTDKTHAGEAPPASRRRPAVLAVSILLAVVACGLLLRLATMRGLFSPLMISGGSMAETFVGEHFELECGECSMPFRCGADVAPAGGLATCPNCGFSDNSLTAHEIQLGEPVLIDQLSPLVRAWRRFDVVALQTSQRPDYLQVKRIVGLPGERVEIRDGDLYADGQIVKKTFAQLREVAIPVNDDNFRPASSADSQGGSRWASDSSDSRWRATPGGFEYAPPDATSSSLDWLTYRHLRSFPGRRTRLEDTVRDNYGYNQGVSRRLFEVSDLMLACRISASQGGLVVLSLHDGRDRHEIRLSRDEPRIVLLTNDVVAASFPGADVLRRGEKLLEMAVCDSQVMLAIDGREIVCCSYEPSDRPFQPTSRPAAIAAQGGRLAVRDLRLFRDLYYLDPARAGWTWTSGQPLPDGQYLLLGDNVPISVDSRRWQPPGASSKYLLGRVLKRSGT